MGGILESDKGICLIEVGDGQRWEVGLGTEARDTPPICAQPGGPRRDAVHHARLEGIVKHLLISQ